MNHVAGRWDTQEEIYKQLKAGWNHLLSFTSVEKKNTYPMLLEV